MNTPLRNLAAAFTLAFVLGSAGCNAQPLTQLVVVTESSLRVPSELDQIEIDITSPSGVMGSRMVAISSPANLPATLGVVHRDGPLGPIHIRVRGRARDMVMVTREADVMLQQGRTLRLDLALDASCRGVTCRADQSCSAGTCRALMIAPSELVDFNGTLPSSADAGSPDAFTPAMCTTSCGNPMHATGICVLGACRLVCQLNRSDCNGLYEDGCEIDLRSATTDCGACGRACDEGERCRSGECD